MYLSRWLTIKTLIPNRKCNYNIERKKKKNNKAKIPQNNNYLGIKLKIVQKKTMNSWFVLSYSVQQI